MGSGLTATERNMSRCRNSDGLVRLQRLCLALPVLARALTGQVAELSGAPPTASGTKVIEPTLGVRMGVMNVAASAGEM